MKRSMMHGKWDANRNYFALGKLQSKTKKYEGSWGKHDYIELIQIEFGECFGSMPVRLCIITERGKLLVETYITNYPINYLFGWL